jgi:hypothetical protein
MFGSSSDQLQFIMIDDFIEYHRVYKRQRESWGVLPAEFLAQRVVQHVRTNQMCVANFCSGPDGLFENKLCSALEKAASRRTSDFKCIVYNFDFQVPKDKPKQVLKGGGVMYTRSLKLNMCKREEVVNALKRKTSGPLKGDVRKMHGAVFSLSLMAKDFVKSLQVAFEIVEPDGFIFICEAAYRFGAGRWGNNVTCRVDKFVEHMIKAGFVFTAEYDRPVGSPPNRMSQQFVYLKFSRPASDVELNMTELEMLSTVFKPEDRNDIDENGGDSDAESVPSTPKKKRARKNSARRVRR